METDRGTLCRTFSRTSMRGLSRIGSRRAARDPARKSSTRRSSGATSCATSARRRATSRSIADLVTELPRSKEIQRARRDHTKVIGAPDLDRLPARLALQESSFLWSDRAANMVVPRLFWTLGPHGTW